MTAVAARRLVAVLPVLAQVTSMQVALLASVVVTMISRSCSTCHPSICAYPVHGKVVTWRISRRRKRQRTCVVTETQESQKRG